MTLGAPACLSDPFLHCFLDTPASQFHPVGIVGRQIFTLLPSKYYIFAIASLMVTRLAWNAKESPENQSTRAENPGILLQSRTSLFSVKEALISKKP